MILVVQGASIADFRKHESLQEIMVVQEVWTNNYRSREELSMTPAIQGGSPADYTVPRFFQGNEVTGEVTLKHCR